MQTPEKTRLDDVIADILAAAAVESEQLALLNKWLNLSCALPLSSVVVTDALDNFRHTLVLLNTAHAALESLKAHGYPRRHTITAHSNVIAELREAEKIMNSVLSKINELPIFEITVSDQTPTA